MRPMIGMDLNDSDIENAPKSSSLRTLQMLVRWSVLLASSQAFNAFRRYHSNDGESLSGIGMGKRGRRAGVAGSSRAWGRAAAR